MNPAPDAELASVGEFYHKWITDAVINLVFKRLGEKEERPRYRWDALLNPEPTRAYAVASAAEQQSRTINPKPVASSEPAGTTKSVKNSAGDSAKKANSRRKKSDA
jgi:hypothetical protein